MLDRLRFVFGFARAYRLARKAGASETDARMAAAQAMIAERLGGESGLSGATDLPPTVAAVWRNPEPVFIAAEGVAESAWFGSGPFETTASHLALLRQARLSWDGAERGAPMLDPARPYGRADLMVQLAEVFATEDAGTLARRHVEMLFVLARALRHGMLRPGRYGLRNIAADDVRAALTGYGGEAGLSDADLGLDGAGKAVVTEEHLKLLRSIEIRWPSQWDAEERLEEGTYPAPTADSKRPYGDYTHIEVDMARILGCLPPPPDDGTPAVFNPEPALAAHLQRLHWQMLGAMQAFVENAEIAPGTYDLA